MVFVAIFETQTGPSTITRWLISARNPSGKLKCIPYDKDKLYADISKYMSLFYYRKFLAHLVLLQYSFEYVEYR